MTLISRRSEDVEVVPLAGGLELLLLVVLGDRRARRHLGSASRPTIPLALVGTELGHGLGVPQEGARDTHPGWISRGIESAAQAGLGCVNHTWRRTPRQCNRAPSERISYSTVGDGHVVPAIDELDDGPDEGDVGRERRVDRRPADEQPDRPGLDDPPHVDVDVRQLLGREPERDGPALAGRQVEPLEAAQLADRPRDRRLLVADVELDDLVAGARAGVRHVDPDRRPCRRSSARMLLSTRRWSIVNVVYDRPWPNGQSGDDVPST